MTNRILAAGLIVLALAPTSHALASTRMQPATSARAPAEVVHFSGSHTETVTTPLEGCLPEDLVGTATITETSTGQIVDTGGNVFIVSGLNEYDDRLELPGGMYVQSWVSRDRYVFVANPPLYVKNVVTQDLRTIYGADSSPIGTLSIHAGFHLTYTDVNGNETPDAGEISSQLEYFRLRCG